MHRECVRGSEAALEEGWTGQELRRGAGADPPIQAMALAGAQVRTPSVSVPSAADAIRLASPQERGAETQVWTLTRGEQ